MCQLSQRRLTRLEIRTLKGLHRLMCYPMGWENKDSLTWRKKNGACCILTVKSHRSQHQRPFISFLQTHGSDPSLLIFNILNSSQVNFMRSHSVLATRLRTTAAPVHRICVSIVSHQVSKTR